MIPFHDGAAWASYRKLAPNGLVPLLRDGDLLIWDSLAIAEYLAERHKGVWPADAKARAFARSAAAEMHSGFADLRDCVRHEYRHPRRPQRRSQSKGSPKTWRGSKRCGPRGLSLFGGPYLAGEAFSAVDAFFGPVAFRVQTFGIKLSDASRLAMCRR